MQGYGLYHHAQLYLKTSFLLNMLVQAYNLSIQEAKTSYIIKPGFKKDSCFLSSW